MKATRIPISQLLCNAFVMPANCYKFSFLEYKISLMISLVLKFLYEHRPRYLLQKTRVNRSSSWSHGSDLFQDFFLELSDHSNGDLLFPGHVVVCALKHLDAAPSPFRERNWNMSRQQMTHSHPEVFVMSVIKYTHILSNFSLLLEPKQYLRQRA